MNHSINFISRCLIHHMYIYIYHYPIWGMFPWLSTSKKNSPSGSLDTRNGPRRAPVLAGDQQIQQLHASPPELQRRLPRRKKSLWLFEPGRSGGFFEKNPWVNDG